MFFSSNEKGHLSILAAVLLPVSSEMVTHEDLSPRYFHNGGGHSITEKNLAFQFQYFGSMKDSHLFCLFCE